MPTRHNYTTDEFHQLIEREGNRVELKTGAGRKPIQEVLVAMSNTDGGVIFLGVKDDRTVVGRKPDQGTEDAINQAARDASNVGRYTIRAGAVDGVPITVVTVHRRDDEVAQTSDGRVLIRRGARNDALFGTDLWALLASRTFRRFEMANSELAGDQVDPGIAAELARQHGWRSEADWQERWLERGLATPSGHLTIAGALVLTDPVLTLDSAKWHVDIRSYEDDESTSYIRREVIGGPVQRQVEQATDWVLRDIGTEMVVTGAYRHDVPRLPRRPVREAISNAIAHRDYSEDRTPTVIEIRPSALTVRSPGRLLPSVEIETLREAQAARNPRVIDILRRFGLAEDSGQGIDLIQDGMRLELLHEPTFREVGNAFEVILPLGGLVTTSERGWLAEHERTGTLQTAERMLLVTVLRDGKITNARAREVMGVDSVAARATLQRMCRANLLQQHGERRRAYYTLGILGPERSPEEVVLAASLEEPLTNERVRELTGLDRREALVLLRRLVSRGKLVQTGTKRGTRYLNRNQFHHQ
mgnify:CR=1 FL=1